MKKNYIAPNSKVDPSCFMSYLMQAASLGGTNLEDLSVGGKTTSADSRSSGWDWDDDDE